MSLIVRARHSDSLKSETHNILGKVEKHGTLYQDTGNLCMQLIRFEFSDFSSYWSRNWQMVNLAADQSFALKTFDRAVKSFQSGSYQSSIKLSIK